MYLYGAFGVTLASERPLTALSPRRLGAAAQPCIALRYGPMPTPSPCRTPLDLVAGGEVRIRIQPTAAGYQFEFAATGTVFQALVRADRRGAEVWTTAHGADDLEVEQHFLGQVVPRLLHGIDRIVLHASAIDLDGAVLLVAPSGTGKSSLAAALQSFGPLITDDGAAIEWRGAVPVVHPAIPSVRLLRDSSAMMQSVIGSAPERSAGEKSRFSAVAVASAVPIRAVLLLSRGDRFQLNELPPTSAFQELLSEVMRVDVLDQARLRHELESLSRLVRTVRVRELIVPESLGELTATASHLAALLKGRDAG